jgi:hypothetical protein
MKSKITPFFKDHKPNEIEFRKYPRVCKFVENDVKVGGMRICSDDSGNYVENFWTVINGVSVEQPFKHENPIRNEFDDSEGGIDFDHAENCKKASAIGLVVKIEPAKSLVWIKIFNEPKLTRFSYAADKKGYVKQTFEDSIVEGNAVRFTGERIVAHSYYSAKIVSSEIEKMKKNPYAEIDSLVSAGLVK